MQCSAGGGAGMGRGGVDKSALVVVGVEQWEEGLAGLSTGAGGVQSGRVLWAAYRGTAGGLLAEGERGSRSVWSGGEQGLVFAESGRASVVGGVAGGRCHVLAGQPCTCTCTCTWLWPCLEPVRPVRVQRQRKARRARAGATAGASRHRQVAAVHQPRRP